MDRPSVCLFTIGPLRPETCHRRRGICPLMPKICPPQPNIGNLPSLDRIPTSGLKSALSRQKSAFKPKICLLSPRPKINPFRLQIRPLKPQIWLLHNQFSPQTSNLLSGLKSALSDPKPDMGDGWMEESKFPCYTGL